MKQHLADYAWSTFVKDGGTAWTGVRNFQARNNLRTVKAGDLVFFYHSGEEKSVVGLARIIEEAYPDPAANKGDWPAVDLAPVKSLIKPVILLYIKPDRILMGTALVKESRLSVRPVTGEQFNRLLELAGMKL